jgi:restriction system protein
MTIPDYQSVFLPLLRLSADGQEHRLSEAIEQLSKELQLTEEESNELLPSGRQSKFYNRVQWAKTYLVQAGLLEATKRSYFRITDRGRKLLEEQPKRLDVNYLSRFPEFLEFRSRGRESNQSPMLEPAMTGSTIASASETPDELLRSTLKSLDSTLAAELLQRILSAPPAFFESTIVTLLLSMGYGGSREEAGRAIGRTGDGGLDGVIDQDPLGLDRVYVQAKRYRPDIGVSEPEIRGFSGSLGAAKANKGVFVTTSYFTKPAIEFAERHSFKMVLIDGTQLTGLMIRHNVGVRIAETL